MTLPFRKARDDGVIRHPLERKWTARSTLSSFRVEDLTSVSRRAQCSFTQSQPATNEVTLVVRPTDTLLHRDHAAPSKLLYIPMIEGDLAFAWREG